MPRAHAAWEIVGALSLAFGVLFLSRFLANPSLRSLLPTLVFLYVPFGLLLAHRLEAERFGLTFRWPPLAAWLTLGQISLAVLIPYVTAYHLLQRYGFHAQLSWAQFPTLAILARQLLLQTLAVALPEEVFFRGYLQTRLQDLPAAPRPVTALIVAAAFFALSHLVLSFQPVRLLTFFPGLVFGWLWLKTRSLYPSILFHALCNVVLFALQAIYVG